MITSGPGAQAKHKTKSQRTGPEDMGNQDPKHTQRKLSGGLMMVWTLLKILA
ncbi:hypothetical protein PDJAM_G00250900 [Pangasius djambal]|uniref:Uncharacterized protein n=1 Tax=Pangasius djambal TaxID=1691987 RepID=A0ACC5YJV6_9TELE|nr:hypothetical protein [Pangasius djambal]